jgi:uncharacterized protein YceH (UPF0502 family)
LLSGEVDVAEIAARSSAPPSDLGDSERMTRLEEEVAALRREVSELKQMFEQFRKQFE